jgi:tRNA A-37 threonylcarbamoyl transferase component Bud32
MNNLLERLKSALADRYAVESEIGRGGMATVFLAEDLRHARQVAIKVLHPELAASLGTDRFLREIKIAAGLDHPHILPLHDSGEADGLLFYVMPYVEGESLAGRLEREGQLPLERALDIAGEVADALAYAHRQGVIHRDIKPGNILLAEGHARIADFGVARALGVASEGDATATGLAVGTPKYMSPEQAAGGEVDGRSDVYALGCVLYEMLAGDPPFDGPTPQVILTRKASETVPGLRVRRKTVPADLEAVINRAMATAPVDRFSRAEEFAKALNAPERVGKTKRAGPRHLRIRFAYVLAVAALVLLAASVWIGRTLAGGDDIDPDTIAVLPFHYTGPSDALKALAAGMPGEFWDRVTGKYGPRSAHHGTVTDLWAAAGGTIERELPEGEALQIARSAGAGALLQGVVTGTENEMGIAATLLEVPTGRVRVLRSKAEGSYAEAPTLINMLINEILAADYAAWTEPDMEEFRQHRPEAVQAYLHGDLHEALALDSTFIFVATLIYQNGERDQAAAQYAWEHQDELRPIDQMYLRALAGWRFGATRTLAERFEQYDSVSRMGGEDWLGEMPHKLFRWGRLVDFPRYRERSKEGLLSAGQVGFDYPLRLQALSEIAAAEGDTTGMRQYAEGIGPLATTADDSLMAAVALLRVALLHADTTWAESLWAEVEALAERPGVDLDWLLILLLDGRGLEDLDRFMLSGDQPGPRNYRTGMFWARARGRYAEWRESRDFWYDRWQDRMSLWGAVFRLRDALFLGEQEDSAVHAAASWIDSVAIGAIVLDTPANDPEPATRLPALARCWTTLWKVSHGDLQGSSEAVRYLRDDVPLPYRYSVCAGLIDVLVAEREGAGLSAAVARLDSIVRPVPMELGHWILTRDGTHWIDNLFLSQKLAQVGNTEAALAASRRAKAWTSGHPWLTAGIFVDVLREEARLTAMVGDTTAAITAYEHWLALRDKRPESPHWAAQWDSVRAEYGALTGRETQ